MIHPGSTTRQLLQAVADSRDPVELAVREDGTVHAGIRAAIVRALRAGYIKLELTPEGFAELLATAKRK